MARQLENGMIIGPLGDKSYYYSQGKYLVRTKGGASKLKIMNYPCFARTRENNREFANAVLVAKEFQRAVRTFSGKAVDITLNARLIRLFLEIARTDTRNPRGKRMAVYGDLSMLKNFELNLKSCICDCLFSSIVADIVEVQNVVKLKLDLSPKDDIKWPLGSNCCKISNVALTIDLLKPYDWEVQCTTTNKLNIDDKIYLIELDTELGWRSGKTMVQLIAMDFYQEVNGELHEMRPHKAIKVVGITHVEKNVR